MIASLDISEFLLVRKDFSQRRKESRKEVLLCVFASLREKTLHAICRLFAFDGLLLATFHVLDPDQPLRLFLFTNHSNERHPYRRRILKLLPELISLGIQINL